jgi:hypothetical protein
MHEDEGKAMIILHRLASKLKRMVVLATEEGGEGELWDLTKGAPETLKAKMTQESAPASCDEIAETVGHWLPDDQIPETLIPILKRMFDEFFPALRDTVRVMEEWKQTHPDKPIARFVGTHTFQIGNVSEERLVPSFQQFKLQRVLDVYRAFNTKEKGAVGEWLINSVGVDANAVFDIEIKERAMLENNKLVWEASPAARL